MIWIVALVSSSGLMLLPLRLQAQEPTFRAIQRTPKEIQAISERSFLTIPILKESQAISERSFFTIPILKNNDSIRFYDIQTRQLLQQITIKKPEIIQKIVNGNATTFIMKYYGYMVSEYGQFLICSESQGGTVKVVSYQNGERKEDSVDPPELRPVVQRTTLFDKTGRRIAELPVGINGDRSIETCLMVLTFCGLFSCKNHV